MIELFFGWLLLSTGVLLAALELYVGTRGAIAAAILWAPVLAIVLASAAVSAVGLLVYVVCMGPVWMVGAVARAWCSRGGRGATERIDGVSE